MTLIHGCLLVVRPGDNVYLGGEGDGAVISTTNESVSGYAIVPLERYEELLPGVEEQIRKNLEEQP